MLRRNIGLALLLVGIPSAGMAQRVLRYGAAHDTLWFQSVNQYRMYFVRGADTLGDPVSTRTLERETFLGGADTLSVNVQLRGLGQFPFTNEQVYGVLSSGKVVAVGGHPVDSVAHARVDLFLHFPTPPRVATPGVAWRDSVSNAHIASYGPENYSVVRDLRVISVADSGGVPVCLVVGAGVMRLRQGGWQDSTAGTRWWQEVQGPVVDSLWFDLLRGAVIQDVAVMRLIGSGGVVGPTGSTPMSSGLLSSVRRTRVSPTAAANLLAGH